MEILAAREADINFSHGLILDAGELARQIMKQDYATKWKSDNTPVTPIDKRINDMLIERIKGAYPNDRIYGEEKSAGGSSGFTWVADPYDGTQSLKLFPTGTICLARTDPDGQPLFSHVLNPATNEVFASTNSGLSTMNEQPMRVSEKDDIKGSYIFLGSRLPDSVASNGIVYDRLEGKGSKIINVRSLAFSCCMVAAGKAEGALIGVKTPFEAASIKLLVENAGGKVTDLDGNSSDRFRYDRDINGLIVSNGRLHDRILATLALAA